MEQAILALVSFSITLTLYLDRQRRIDMRVQTAAIDRRFAEQTAAINRRFAEQTAAIDKQFSRSEKRLNKAVKRLDARIDELNRSVVELANKMGQVEGRTEVLAGR
ncbi:MAG: hypothetical protein OXG52_11785 [bacterium]|nr:hypothetical protein [bacterium]